MFCEWNDWTPTTSTILLCSMWFQLAEGFPWFPIDFRLTQAPWRHTSINLPLSTAVALTSLLEFNSLVHVWTKAVMRQRAEGLWWYLKWAALSMLFLSKCYLIASSMIPSINLIKSGLGCSTCGVVIGLVAFVPFHRDRKYWGTFFHIVR